MKALVVTPKSQSKFRFVSDLLKKLGVGSSSVSQSDLEDIGMSKLLHEVDRSKKVSRTEIMKKLTA